MPDTDTNALYQAFPHLRRIDELWGTQQGRDYIKDLIGDTRGGTRQGFPDEHASTILQLLREHDDLFPQFEESFGDGLAYGPTHEAPPSLIGLEEEDAKAPIVWPDSNPLKDDH